ncbi:hypothetical protein [Nonomuraea sp. SYSU D8015]|uniref:hypothetical protein n=1 Tax=Nonomuraea sp. SYSU D8015 TaxID=2593644 RepID=UPI0016607F1C|nr:hypothetical protein [Nonomuraea sp. SYSU D8015]
MKTRSSQLADATAAAGAEGAACRSGAYRTTSPADTISATLSTIPSTSAPRAGCARPMT